MIKIKRKIIAVMMAIIVAVSCFSINCFALTHNDYGGFTFDSYEEYYSVTDYHNWSFIKYSSSDFSDAKKIKFLSGSYIKHICNLINPNVDYANPSLGYKMLVTISQYPSSLPIYRIYFIKPLSDDFKLITTDFKTVHSVGDCDIQQFGFQVIKYPSYVDISYPEFLGSYSSISSVDFPFISLCDLPVYNSDGEVLNDSYTASISVNAEKTELFGEVSAGQSALTVSMYIADSQGQTVGINYTTGGSCSAKDTWSHTFDLVNLRTELEDQDIDYDDCLGVLLVTDSFGNTSEYSCPLGGTGEKDGLFSKEKELTPFTDIEDYVDWDFEPFPGFDPSHPIDSIAEILKWMGGIIKKIVLNIVGILRWLKDNFFILIENIGKLLYNLVVKLRNLIESLFIPDVNKIFKKINVFVPVDEISSGIKNLQNSVQNHGFTFTLLGQEVNFYISNYIPQDAANVLRSLSSVLILAFGLMSCYNTILSFAGIAVANAVKEDK